MPVLELQTTGFATNVWWVSAISQQKVWNHPTEATISPWLFEVPGSTTPECGCAWSAAWGSAPIEALEGFLEITSRREEIAHESNPKLWLRDLCICMHIYCLPNKQMNSRISKLVLCLVRWDRSSTTRHPTSKMLPSTTTECLQVCIFHILFDLGVRVQCLSDTQLTKQQWDKADWNVRTL